MNDQRAGRVATGVRLETPPRAGGPNPVPIHARLLNRLRRRRAPRYLRRARLPLAALVIHSGAALLLELVSSAHELATTAR